MISLRETAFSNLRDSEFIADSVEAAEHDPISGIPVVFGYRFVTQVPPTIFNDAKRYLKLISNGIFWWVHSHDADPKSIVSSSGGISKVGIGPAGGFKWVELKDGSRHGHAIFREMAKEFCSNNPKNVVKCDVSGSPSRRTAVVSKVRIRN